MIPRSLTESRISLGRLRKPQRMFSKAQHWAQCYSCHLAVLLLPLSKLRSLAAVRLHNGFDQQREREILEKMQLNTDHFLFLWWIQRLVGPTENIKLFTRSRVSITLKHQQVSVAGFAMLLVSVTVIHLCLLRGETANGNDSQEDAHALE